MTVHVLEGLEALDPPAFAAACESLWGHGDVPRDASQSSANPENRSNLAGERSKVHDSRLSSRFYVQRPYAVVIRISVSHIIRPAVRVLLTRGSLCSLVLFKPLVFCSIPICEICIVDHLWNQQDNVNRALLFVS